MLSDSRMIPMPEAIKLRLSGLHSKSQRIRKVEHPSHEQHPFRTHVNPHMGETLGKMWLDKRYVRGKGSLLFDETGRQYLDCIAAYGALPFGFNPPEIWQSLHEVETLGEPSFVQPSLLDAAGELAKRLLEVAPANLRYVTFTNSGTESVEAAIKLCRAATNRAGILSTDNSFHGKTLGALSATGNPDYHTGFAVPLAGFSQIPFGDVDALERELTANPDFYAAFIVEPIQGEGGIVEAPAGYLAAARELCTKFGVLLVFDEIQTGLGRTGAMFRCQDEGVEPDVMTVAKALGGGLMPIGAVLCTEAAYTERFANKHSSTFAGNTLSCRAGLATLELLTRHHGDLVDQVRRNGRRLRRRLEDLQKRYPHMISGIRGRGYMLGIEFGIHRTTWSDSVLGAFADQGLFTPLFASYLLNVEGLRVAPTLNGKSVIRIEPALNFTWDQCEELLAGLQRALEAFSDGNIGRIFSKLMNDTHAVAPSPMMVEQEGVPEPREGERRFAFLLHPLDAGSFVDYDPTLEILSRPNLEDLQKRLSGLVDPFVLNGARVVSKTGESIFGEFIVVPRTAREMVDLPRAQVAAEVRAALDLARSRGAQMVGLGAYTSVVTRGGHALAGHGVPLTTGNSFTTVACAEGIQVFLDGRPLPQDPNPTWMGYSVGRWDGDALVVDTTGYNDRTWLDITGHPHTEALHLTERFRRQDTGHMTLEMTFDDPKTYTRPWTISVGIELVPDTDLLEFVCNENEKDRDRYVGDADAEKLRAVALAPDVLARYAGDSNAGPLGILHISFDNGSLAFAFPGTGARHAVLAQSADDFLVPDLGTPIRFLKDSAGNVTHLRVTIVEGDIDAVRVNANAR